MPIRNPAQYRRPKFNLIRFWQFLTCSLFNLLTIRHAAHCGDTSNIKCVLGEETEIFFFFTSRELCCLSRRSVRPALNRHADVIISKAEYWRCKEQFVMICCYLNIFFIEQLNDWTFFFHWTICYDLLSKVWWNVETLFKFHLSQKF